MSRFRCAVTVSEPLGFFTCMIKVQNGGNFLGLLKFKIFLWCLIFLIFYGVNGRCWARARLVQSIQLDFIFSLKQVTLKYLS